MITKQKRQLANSLLAIVILMFTGFPSARMPVQASSPGAAVAALTIDARNVIATQQEGGLTRLNQFGQGTPDAVSVSNSGDLLAVQLPNQVRFYDAVSLKQRSVIETDGLLIDAVLEPDGDTFVGIGQGGIVYRWRIRDGTLKDTVQLVDGDKAGRLSLSSDGSAIAMRVRNDNTDELRVASTRDGAVEHVIETPTEQIIQLALSPDGDLLAASNRDNSITIWRVSDGSILKSLNGHSSSVMDIVFAPDSKALASTSLDGSVRVWNIQGGTSAVVSQLPQYGGYANELAYSPDGTTLAASVGLSNPTGVQIQTWNVESRELLNTWDGHRQPPGSLALDAQAKTLVSASEDGTVRVWSLQDDAQIGVLNFTPRILDFDVSPDGTLLAVGLADGAVQLWDVDDGSVVASVAGHGLDVMTLDVAFHPSGTMVASGAFASDDGVKLWRIDGNQLVQDWFKQYEYNVTFSPDGETWATNRTIFRTSDATRLVSIQPSKEHNVIGHSSFGPDGTMLAGVVDNNTVEVWSTSSGAPLRTMPAQTAKVDEVDFSPDGNTLAAASWDGTVRTWRITDGVELNNFQLPGAQSVEFAPDGLSIAGASGGGRIAVWRTEDGELVSQLRALGDKVRFGPEGRLYTSYQGLLSVWRVDPSVTFVENPAGQATPQVSNTPPTNDQGVQATATPQVLPARINIGISPLGQVAGGDKPGTEGQRYMAPSHMIDVDAGMAYVAAGENGVHVVDISNPSALRSVAMVPAFDPALNIAVKDGIAYVGETNSFEIIDERDPQNPRQLKRLGSATGAPAVAASGDLLFMVADSRLRIFDIADAAAPTDLASYSVPEGSNNLAYDTETKTLYVIIGDNSGLALDVSNPSSPRQVAGVTDGIGVVAEAAQGRLYGTEYGVLRAFSVEDGSLKQLGQQGSELYSGGYDQMSEGLGMRIDGNLLYGADYRNGLYIFDVSNPETMYVRGYYYPGDFWQYLDVEVADGVAYAVTENGGLVSFSVNGAGASAPTPQPTRPPPPATTPEPPSGLSGKIVFLSSRDYPDYRPESGGLGPHDIYVMAPDGTNQTRISSGERLSNMSAPAVSPDGLKIAVGRYGNKLTIYDESGGQVSEYQAPGDVNALWVNDWSSDGNRLLLTVFGPSSGSSDWNEEIFDLDLANGQWTQLTDNSQRNLFATWSPDGTKIAYMQDYTLWLMDSDGKNQKELIDGEARDMDWSPDGTRIVFESQEVPAASSDYDFWTVSPNGTDKKRVTNTPGLYLYQPSWSPDGKYIAFVGYPDGPSKLGQIYVVEVDTGEMTQITTQGDNVAPFWVGKMVPTPTPGIDPALFNKKQTSIEVLSKLPIKFLFDMATYEADLAYQEEASQEVLDLVREKQNAGTATDLEASAFRRLVLDEQVQEQLYRQAMESTTDMVDGTLSVASLSLGTIKSLVVSTDPVINQGGVQGKLLAKLRKEMQSKLLDISEHPIQLIIKQLPESWDPEVIESARKIAYDSIQLELDEGTALQDIISETAIRGPFASALLRGYHVTKTQPLIDEAVAIARNPDPSQVVGSDARAEVAAIGNGGFVYQAQIRTELTHSLYEDFAEAVDRADMIASIMDLGAMNPGTAGWAKALATLARALGAMSSVCGIHEGFVNAQFLTDWARETHKYIFKPVGPSPISDYPIQTGACSSIWIPDARSLDGGPVSPVDLTTGTPTTQPIRNAMRRLELAIDAKNETELERALEQVLETEAEMSQQLATLGADNEASSNPVVDQARVRFEAEMIGLYAYGISLLANPSEAEIGTELRQQIIATASSLQAYEKAVQPFLGATPTAAGGVASSDRGLPASESKESVGNDREARGLPFVIIGLLVAIIGAFAAATFVAKRRSRQI